MANGNGTVHALERNRFYYGKPMDVRHWQIEQSYGIEARSLLIRLGLGTGVLCGLGVSLAADGCLMIEPGVAVDAAGREIVVPAPVCLQNPAQPTDCMGVADGAAVTDGSVTVVLCYHECLAEPEKAIACGCDTADRCEHGIVQERFCLRVDRDRPPSRDFPCDTVYPAPPPEPFDRRRAIFEVLGGPCAPASEDCVALATVAFAPNAAPVVDDYTVRRSLYSNQTLFELILCLAARVDKCCGKHDAPPIAPPRITAFWPNDKGFTLPAADKKRFIKLPHIEITFERAMDASDLAAPDPWLGVYSIRASDNVVAARRVPLTLDSTVATAAGGVVASYSFDEEYRSEMKTARTLVQARADDGGGRLLVDTGSPAQLLDGEHHGTALTAAQLDEIWTTVSLAAGKVSVDPAIWPALAAGAPPDFPTGNGVEGGRLDLAFSLLAPPTQPQLKAVWPPSAAFLDPRGQDADLRKWAQSFIKKEPRLELTFDDSLDQGALSALPLEDWLGLWWVYDPAKGKTSRVKLTPAGPRAPGTLGIGGATVTLVFDAKVPLSDLAREGPNHFVVVVRGDKASVDADFASPALPPLAVDDLFDNDRWPQGRAVDGPPSLGAAMADGSPGGTAIAHFDVALPS
jgi:hypothetical protein